MDKKELRKKREKIGIEILQEIMEKIRKKKKEEKKREKNIKIQVQCYKRIRVERVLEKGKKNKQILVKQQDIDIDVRTK